MEDVKVSIIIPIYNTEAYIEQCLLSAVNQTLDGVEIICVNDGTTDGSMHIVEKIAEGNNSIQIINQTNMGLSDARNTGLRHASGKYILFLDSDDFIVENAAEIAYLQCERQSLDLLLFSADIFWDKPDDKANFPEFEKGRYQRKGEYTEVLQGCALLPVLNRNKDYFSPVYLQLIRKDLLFDNDIRFYSGILHEDVLFTFHLLLKAKRTFCIPDCLYMRRIRAGSIMTSKTTWLNMYSNLVSLKEQLRLLSDNVSIAEQFGLYEIVRLQNEHMLKVLKALSEEETEKFYNKLNDQDLVIFKTVISNQIWYRDRLDEVKQHRLRLTEKYESELNNLKADRQKLRDEVQKLEEDRQKYREEIRVLNEHRLKQKSDIKQLEEDRENYRNEIQKLKEDRENYRNEIQKLNEDRQKLREKIDVLNNNTEANMSRND